MAEFTPEQLCRDFAKELSISSKPEDKKSEELVSSTQALPTSQSSESATATVHETESYDSSTAETSEVAAEIVVTDEKMDLMYPEYKKLALCKEFHATLIADKMFCPFLVLSLTSDSSSVVHRALEILHLFALHPENANGLSKVQNFFDGLQTVIRKLELPAEIRDFALLVHDLVKKAQQIPLRTQSGSKQNQTQGIPEKAAKKAESLSGKRGHNQSVSKSKTVELYVPFCIFKQQRLKMTEALLTLNGIISITYDLKKCYCLVRVKPHIPCELFGKAIANLYFECHLVSREGDQIVMTLMTPDPKLENNLSLYDKENSGRKSPQYLSSDNESDLSMEESQSVAKTTAKTENQKKGWFSSASDFLQKSFYW